MDCQRVAELLCLRPDDVVGRAALADHLADCASCAADAERQVRLDDALRASLVAAPPPELSQRLIAMARGERLEAGGWRLERPRLPSNLQPTTSNARRPRRPAQRVAAYLLAAVAAIALGATVWPGHWLALLSLGREVLAAAQVILSSPVFWLLPEPAELIAWFVPALALLVLAWVLRLAETRPRPQRARRA